jgi:Homeodomain-like domain
MFDSTQIADSRTPPNALNMTTKAELLRRGKAAIDAGESSLREAAEALALAQQDFKATQREIAEAVGRSLGWVNRLLKWRRSGYKDSSPFGPTTKVGRVQHAEQRTKPRKPKASPTTASPDAKTSPIADTEKSGSKRPSPQEAKGNLKYAVDHWWPHLDDAGKVEITAYFLKKTGARVS